MASSWSTLLLALSVLCLADADVKVFGIRGFELHGDAWSAPDPFVKVFCGNTFGGETGYMWDHPNPSWTVSFIFPDCRVGEVLKLEVWDVDLNFNDHLGDCATNVHTGTTVPVSCKLRHGKVEFSYVYVN